MLKLWVRFQNRMRGQEGQALSEYGMVIALILVASIAALIAFRQELANVFNDMTDAMRNR